MHWLDISVLVLYGLIVVGLGSWAGRREKTIEDFFLAGRAVSWPLVMISIYATSASALTFIGVPGAAYGGDFNYLNLAFGTIIGRILIALLLLTTYFKGKVVTVYQLLGQRFGERSHDGGTGLFIVTRLLASGVRLAGCAIALAVVFKISLTAAITLVAAMATIYTLIGGLKAVILTDLLQFIIFVGGAIFVLVFIISSLPGGFEQFLSIGDASKKFAFFNFDFSLNNPKSFFTGILFGCVITFAAMGCDHDLVQRMLSSRTLKGSQRAVILTGFMDIPITLLFLSIGAALFAYYQVFPDAAVAGLKSNDHVFPHFISTALPIGLGGLLVAGLLAAAMSSLDSALNALAASAVVDFYLRYSKKKLSDKNQIDVARNFIVLFAVALTFIAMLFGEAQSILWIGFKSVGFTYGGLLGIFLLAVLTKTRGNDKLNLIALLSSVLVSFFAISLGQGNDGSLKFIFPWQEGKPLLAWQWAVIIAMLWTFSIGYLFKTENAENRA